MCGIAGIIRLDGGSVDSSMLNRLTDALAHRGPDGRGTYIEGSVGLGQRRLKILDVSDAAKQPMVSDDGRLVMVFNGEIYNFQELRRELEAKGYRFRSTGDTEVLLRLYEEEGIACVERLRGMFAFAVYDRKKQSVFLARDRVGKKPIKYFRTGNCFAFASELKALMLLPECPRGVHEESIHHYLTMMYVPSPETGRINIRKMGPATTMTIDLSQGTVTPEQRYWKLDYRTKELYSIDEWEERIREAVDESVRLRMIADVPVGAFLSGGIDSAAVVASMAKHSPHPVQTFSIGTDVQTHNELPYAAITAKTFGTSHHPIVVEPDIVHLLPELVHAYEEPFADPSSIPSFLIAKETRKHVTVALNGDGGDENFAGYVRYPILHFSLLWEQYPHFLHAPVRGMTHIVHACMQSTFSERCLRFERSMSLPWRQRYLQYLSFFTEEEKKALFMKDVCATCASTDAWFAKRWEQDAKSEGKTVSERIEQAVAWDLQTYLADDLLPKVDLATMAHGLEARSPLLDHKLLELTAAMPLSLKLRRGTRKWIFRRMLHGTLPPDILSKPKTGFRLPLDQWFRTTLRPFIDDRLLDPASTLRRFFNPEALERFLTSYHESSIDKSDRIWALLWLEEWLRQYA